MAHMSTDAGQDRCFFCFAFEGVEEIVQMKGSAFDKCPVVIYHAQELL